MHTFSFWLSLFVTALIAVQPAQAQQSEPIVHAELLIDGAQVKEGEPFWAAIRYQITDGWHIYWQNAGDSGISTELTWQLPDGYSAGPVHWQPPQRIEYSGLFNYGYEGETVLLVPLTAPASIDEGQVTFSVKADWLVCKDICIPESADLTMSVTPGETNEQAAEVIEEYETGLPKLVKETGHYNIDGKMVTINLPSPVKDSIARLWWFPIDDGIISNGSEQPWELKGSRLVITAERGSGDPADTFSGVLSLQTPGGESYWQIKTIQGNVEEAAAATEQSASADTATASGSGGTNGIGWLGAIFSAFIGGLILNIMPCVLPILSLKALGVAKKAAHEPAKVRTLGFAYTAGILLTFGVIAGILIGLQQAGEAVGWGFQLQSPIFVTILIYVMFLVGLNLSGVFELPVLLGNIGGMTTRDDMGGTFCTGVLAAVVATPCTAPFMAAAIGFALGQPPFIALLIFLSLGLGLAFPFLLISLVPALYRALPKPGIWMVRFRQFLAFPIYATAAWLLWVLVQQSGPMGLAMALAGLCLLAFVVWLLPLFKTPVARLIAVVIAAALLWGTVSEQSFSHQGEMSQLSEGGRSFSLQELNDLRASGTPVFVDATAAWCITCKVNERVALSADSVQQLFKDRGVVMLVADWTNRDKEITDYLASFGRNGVPIYVYYPPQGEPVILPQILTPQIVIDAIAG